MKRVTESKQHLLSVTTVDGSQDSEQEKQPMRERKDVKKNVNPSVHAVITEYVNTHKWDTLVGKAFHMGSEESRQEFIEFLTTHIHAVMDVGNEMRKKRNV